MKTQVVPPTGQFTAAQRINRSVTAHLEKRLLLWLAEHAPGWVTSDHLTLLGLLSQTFVGVCYVLGSANRWFLLAGIVFLFLNWLGDSLDGTLARVRRQQRPRYGFYVDHAVDILSATAMMVGLGWSGFAHWQVATGMLIAFLLLASESYLATYTLGIFEMSQAFFGPTEIRILLALGNLAVFRSRYVSVFGHSLLLFDLGGCIATAAMSALAVLTVAKHTARLYREEPLPRP